MAFTDDDLKRVKAKLKGASETIDFDLPALLARLEAAERIVRWAHGICPADWETAWRKSAGK